MHTRKIRFTPLGTVLLSSAFCIALVNGAFAQTISVFDGATPTGVAPGAPAGSYPLTGFEHYNPFSGSLNAAIPLYHVGGRGEAGLDIVWNFQQMWAASKQFAGQTPYIAVDPYPQSYPNGSPNASGLGIAGAVYGRTGASYIACGSQPPVPGTTVTRIIFQQGNGTQIELVDQNTNGGSYTIPNACTTQPNSWNAGRGTTFHSTDARSLTFVSDSAVLDWNPLGAAKGAAALSGYLYFPNGLTYRIDSSHVTWMRDRNGNWINFQYTNGPYVFVNWYLSVQAPTLITDSVNRTITINYNYTDSSCSGCTAITYPGAGGASRTIRIGLTNLSNNLLRSGYSIEALNQLFPQESAGTTYNFDPVLASYIQFPDNRQFTFEYDSYGELARVNLPTGGAIEYDYGDGQNAASNGFEGSTTDANAVMVYRRLQQRREYAAGGSAFTARTQYTVTYPGTATVDTDITYNATGNPLAKTVHTLDGSPLDALEMTGTSCNAWNEGLEAQTDYGTPNPIVTVKNTYATQSGCMSNPHLTTRLTILDDTNQVSEVTFSYDSYNNVAAEIEYDWGSGVPGPAVRQTQTVYNTSPQYLNLNLVSLPAEVKILDGSGTLRADTQLAYDNGSLAAAPSIIGHDNQNFAGFAPRGNVTSIARCLNAGNCTWLTTSIAYDIAGNAVSVTDPNNHSTAYSYVDSYSDGESRNSYAHVTSVTNALGQKTSASYDYSTGKATGTADLDGVNAAYSYNDPLERLTQGRQAAGAGSSVESQTNYSYPNPNTVITYQDQNTTADQALHSQVLYDGFGRESETDVYESSSQYIARTQTYDALGRIATASNPYRPGDAIYYTSYTYDSLNRPTQVLTADGSATTTSYSGNQTTVTDPAGKARQSNTDALGRLTQVVEDPNALKYTTSYSYDVLDGLLSVSQSGQSRSFAYDSLERLISATNPESGTTAYSYDNAGNLTTQTDARGIATNFSYDALNRIMGKTYSDGTAAVVYAYDNPAVPYGVGRLTQVSNGWSTTNSTAYDPLGRILAGQQITDGQTYNFAYTYNVAGALTSEMYPSGRVMNTGYDTAGRVLSVFGGLGTQQTTYVNGVSYAPHGEPVLYGYGNTVYRNFSYNNRLQPYWSADMVNNNSGNQLLAMIWGWGGTNNNGNLQSLGLNNGGPGYPQFLSFTQVFSYDGVNRLTAASDSGGWSRSFSYDPYGNMWTPSSTGVPVNGMMPTTDIFNPANNRISGGTYDAAGNQTIVGSYSMAYDAADHQTIAYDNVTQGQATYVYDGDGHRVQKVISGGPTTTYIYDALGQLVAEYSSAAPPAAPCYTCYLSYDHLGTPRLITDSAANIIARHDYLPFGEEIPANTAGRRAEWGSGADNINQKFTGQERDSETGLDFFQSRYMSAAQGRFNSPDPGNAGADLTNPQSWNGYSYVWNNPLSAVDPTGMDIWFPEPCDDPEDPECGGEPPSPCFFLDCGGGGNGGGQRGTGQGGNQTPPSYPLPPGSFPGGETLGLPPGISIPSPLWPIPECEFGPCWFQYGSGATDNTTQTGVTIPPMVWKVEQPTIRSARPPALYPAAAPEKPTDPNLPSTVGNWPQSGSYGTWVACEYSTTVDDIISNPEAWIVGTGTSVIIAIRGARWFSAIGGAVATATVILPRMLIIRQACHGQVYGR